MITIPLAALSLLLAQPEGRVEAFPGVVVDYSTRTIELSGVVPIDAHSEETPDVTIELIAEHGGVRDYEALIRIDAQPRHVHAALLMLDLEPGSPGLILNSGKRIEPDGPPLEIAVTYQVDGETITESPIEWVRAEQSGERLADRTPTFIFGGSSEREFGGSNHYMASVEGVVVGLCTFGTGNGEQQNGVETIGMIPVLSPDVDAGDPHWLADPDRIPVEGTPIMLALTAADQ